MTGTFAATAPQTTEWHLSLRLTESGDLTTAHAELTTAAAHLQADGQALRSPHDQPTSLIGDELAAGRALADLGHQLIRAGAVAAEAAESARRRDAG
ncbi:dsRBD fold-containing protein [Kitasatospora sp. NPDC002227]|uniref:dsRBD fold-containing protein n=1 Tax=Kitasatospora sp. NPDC002227 TaxID=3154773 RepID=UPI00331E46FF